MGACVLQNKELPDTETCWALLNRLLASPQLKRSARMRNLLAYVGRRALEEGCERLHEHEIGAEVFGRPAAYDTSVDNIVRVNVTELRKRIESYFETDGQDETLIMEIPRRRYIPIFKYRPLESHVASKPPFPSFVEAHERREPATAGAATPASRRWWIAAAVASTLTIEALAAECLHLWLQNQALHRLLHR